jgi:hypothetical protein
MGSATSAITIQFDAAQPFMAGQHVTGTVMFNNTSGKSVKFQHIYAELVGEVVYTIKQSRGYVYTHVTQHDPFFRQLINMEEHSVREFVFKMIISHLIFSICAKICKMC